MKRMSLKKKIVIGINILAIVGFLTIIFVQNKDDNIINLSNEDKTTEFNYLVENLKTEYPFVVEAEEQGISIDNLYQAYLPLVEGSKTDIEYFKQLEGFISEFKGIGQLTLFDGKTYQLYKDNLRKEEASNDSEIKSSYAFLYTRQLLNNENSKTLYKQLDTNISSFRRGKVKKEDSVSAFNDYDDRSNVQSEIMNSGEVAYLKIDSFKQDDLAKDKDLLSNFFASTKNCGSLIIDLTDNAGGVDNYWRELIVKPLLKERLTHTKYYLSRTGNEEIKQYTEKVIGDQLMPINSIPMYDAIDVRLTTFLHQYISQTETFDVNQYSSFDGDIYILTSSAVYSAADNFVSFCTNTKFATVIGKNTSGNGGIESFLFTLPKSGLIYSHGIVHSLNNDGSNNAQIGTKPDILSETDDVLKEALKYIESKKSE